MVDESTKPEPEKKPEDEMSIKLNQDLKARVEFLQKQKGKDVDPSRKNPLEKIDKTVEQLSGYVACAAVQATLKSFREKQQDGSRSFEGMAKIDLSFEAKGLHVLNKLASVLCIYGYARHMKETYYHVLPAEVIDELNKDIVNYDTKADSLINKLSETLHILDRIHDGIGIFNHIEGDIDND